MSLDQAGIQAILKKIGTSGSLEPVRTTGGGFSYPILTELLPDVPQAEIIAKLEGEDLVKRTIYASEISCTNSHELEKGTNLAVIASCTKCSAESVVRERLVEHRPAGHIHPESEFLKGGKMICPTCKAELATSEDTKILGTWFQCSVCNTKHSELNVSFQCLICGEKFERNKAIIRPVYKYELANKAQEFFKMGRDIVLSIVYDNLSKVSTGDKVERNFSVNGKSGVAHVFDFSFSVDKKQVLCDVEFSEEEAAESSIMKVFAKTMDTAVRQFILIVWPKVSSAAGSLASFYKIKFIEVDNEGALAAKLEEVIAVIKKEKK